MSRAGPDRTAADAQPPTTTPPHGSCGAVDVHYLPDGGARAALVVAADPQLAEITGERLALVAQVSPYRPGRFAERELPALRAVLTGVQLDLLVVDGYVDLDPAGRPGLSRHVSDEFGVAVVGVAKREFQGASHARQVRRGRARRPLFVTAAGLDVAEAAALVAEMAGEHRIPDALSRVDTLARTGVTSAALRSRS